ncbi:MAG: BMP family ABC transporter substrate-binding protein [Eubacterium sp.]|nr:BMP family ABC transporter substrate-binding protein [Eubacterium sp.]
MSLELYEKARKMGLKAYKQDVSKQKQPYLPVLDELINKDDVSSDVSLGLVDIPLDRVVGTSNAGRTQAFASNFMPLMDEKTEFCAKWSSLCDSHLEEGIHDAIKVYEYLNYYYVVEGNKRVSVLKFFEADSIPAFVTRKVPKYDETNNEIKIYYEFMDFNKKTGVNFIWFSKPGSYSQLIEEVNIAEKHGGEVGVSEEISSIGTAADTADGSGIALRSQESKIWSEDTLLELKAAYRRFDKAFKARGGQHLENITTGDAFLTFIKLQGFDTICDMGLEVIQSEITAMWQEFLVINDSNDVEVSLTPPEEKKKVFSHILSSMYSASRPLKVAFVYSTDPSQSDWFYGHELGRNHIKEKFGDKIVTYKVTTAVNEQDAIEIMENLIEKQKVDVIFTPITQLVDASLKCAIKYPNVKILNCSLNTSHRYIRMYDARLYEAKFLSGMVAGALTETDKIGYLAEYPVFGITANINAFAQGAKMVNPRAKIYLKWRALKSTELVEDLYHEFYEEGIDFVSDQDMITPNRASRNFGLYRVTTEGPLNMTMATYNWGVMYERIINMIMRGEWDNADAESESTPINYWWGLSAGVVDLILSGKVPAGTRRLVNTIKELIIEDRFPVFGEIYSQDGKLRNAEGNKFEVEDVIKMNWLADNVVGTIPEIDELKEDVKEVVEMKGIQTEKTDSEE